MKRSKTPALRSILIAHAGEINGKTVRQIQEYIVEKYGLTFEERQVTDALERLASVGMVALKGRNWTMSAELLH